MSNKIWKVLTFFCMILSIIAIAVATYAIVKPPSYSVELTNTTPVAVHYETADGEKLSEYDTTMTLEQYVWATDDGILSKVYALGFALDNDLVPHGSVEMSSTRALIEKWGY